MKNAKSNIDPDLNVEEQDEPDLNDVSELEKEFNSLVNTVGQTIQDKLNIAEKALAEACELANKHGIPFEASVSQIGQTYVPSSFSGKFGSLDLEKIEELTKVSSWDLEGDYHRGWHHSQVC